MNLCFQAQQAAEKALKAVIVYLNNEPVKTHNIVTLIKSLPQYISIPETVTNAAILNDYAVQTRYPGDYTPIESVEHENAVKIASDCIKWAVRTIKGLENKARMEQGQPTFSNLDSLDDA